MNQKSPKAQKIASKEAKIETKTNKQMKNQNIKKTSTSKMVNIKTYLRKIVNVGFYSPAPTEICGPKIVSEKKTSRNKTRLYTRNMRAAF